MLMSNIVILRAERAGNFLTSAPPPPPPNMDEHGSPPLVNALKTVSVNIQRNWNSHVFRFTAQLNKCNFLNKVLNSCSMP